MKLKYYLRGLGIGIIVTTVILMISFSKREVKMSDEEVIARATQLGMVMKEEDQTETDTEMDTETDQEAETESGGDDSQNVQPDTADLNTIDGGMAEQPDTVTPDAAENQDTIPEEGVYRLVIQKGDVCRVVCENLAANGVVSDAETMRKYLFEIGYASNMSVGEYDIPYGLTNEEVAQILQAGPLEE